jgi:hypothetical protein
MASLYFLGRMWGKISIFIFLTSAVNLFFISLLAQFGQVLLLALTYSEYSGPHPGHALGGGLAVLDGYSFGILHFLFGTHLTQYACILSPPFL